MIETKGSKGKTEDIILDKAIGLMERRGFKAVTTKEIAADSGFSEMTLFRHFGTKQKLLERAIDTHIPLMDLQSVLYSHVTYDLETDLKLVSKIYHNYYGNNCRMVLLSFQERHTNPLIGEKISENTKQIKVFLTSYFEEMQRRGKMADIDLEMQACNFLWLNLGYFMSLQTGEKNNARASLNTFIEESVGLFARGLAVENSAVTL